MTTKEEALQIIDATIWNMKQLEAYILGAPEPQPEPPPEPTRPTAFVRVKVLKCHLRFISNLDGAGKAVWGAYPKGSENPKRDRYLAYFGKKVQVFIDGGIKYGPYKGAVKGTGGNHGWGVVPGQIFNKHIVPENPKLYILCKDVTKI